MNQVSLIAAEKLSNAAPPVRIDVSKDTTDEAWDGFLDATPGGHHVQTSLWAQLKATLGWTAVRLIAKEEARIVGGAQMLSRTYGSRLRIGYIPKGPIFSSANERAITPFMQALEEEVRAQNLHCVIVQLAAQSASIQKFQNGCYQPVRLATFLQSTAVVDLRPPLDDILAGMRPKTRKSVRQSQRRGVRVRRGGDEDVATFFKLFAATAKRQEFNDYDASYFQRLWDLFRPRGYAELFLAEVNGKAISAALRIAFGDTVICKKRGWSGQHGDKRPNEALEWTAMQWAKESGYDYYDFEGIPLPLAQACLRGDGLPQTAQQSPASYKLGYGGKVQILPDPLLYTPNRIGRWGLRTVYPKIANWSVIDRLANRIKVN